MLQNHPDLVNSIPSRALEVWRRLYTRYTLEPGPASIAPDVLKTIVPVTQADLLLARHLGVTTTTPVSATGSLVVHTVPAGVRRSFVTLTLQRTGATFTFDLVNVIDVSEGVTVRIAPQAQTDNFQLDPQSAPLQLEEGDQISVNVDTQSGSPNMLMAAWVIDEDLF